MAKLTTQEKKDILVTLVETCCMYGIGIDDIIFKPLNHWNYNGLIDYIFETHEEYENKEYKEENSDLLKLKR